MFFATFFCSLIGIVKAMARRPAFFDQLEPWFFEKSSLSSLIRLIICRSTSFGSPTIGRSRVHLPSDARRHWVELDVLGLVVPGRHAARNAHRSRSGSRASTTSAPPVNGFLKAPRIASGCSSETDALAGAPRIDRDIRQLDELAASRAPACDQNSAVAACDQRTLGRDQQFDRAIDFRRIARGADVVERKSRAAFALPGVFLVVIKNVLRNLEQRHALRRRRSPRGRPTQSNSNRADQSVTRLVYLAKLSTTSEP